MRGSGHVMSTVWARSYARAAGRAQRALSHVRMLYTIRPIAEQEKNTRMNPQDVVILVIKSIVSVSLELVVSYGYMQ